MDVIIVQEDPQAADRLADEVVGAGGSVVGIAHSLEDARTLIDDGQGPTILLIDAKFSSLADSRAVLGAQESKGQFCIFTAGQPTDVPDDLRRKWPVLRGPHTHDDMRLLIQAARHFGPLSEAVH